MNSCVLPYLSARLTIKGENVHALYPVTGHYLIGIFPLLLYSELPKSGKVRWARTCK